VVGDDYVADSGVPRHPKARHLKAVFKWEFKELVSSTSGRVAGIAVCAKRKRKSGDNLAAPASRLKSAIAGCEVIVMKRCFVLRFARVAMRTVTIGTVTIGTVTIGTASAV
jgi:hypothetical protein